MRRVGSAEGATAPETLRQRDRSHAFISEELLAHSSASAPKEQTVRAQRHCESLRSKNRGGALDTRLACLALNPSTFLKVLFL
jgi:hypothetical protein